MDTELFNFTFALAEATICFLIYHFFVYEKVHAEQHSDSSKVTENDRLIIQKRIWGGFILGIIPLISSFLFLDLGFSDLGFTVESLLKSIPILGIMCGLIFAITFLTAKSPGNLAMYPEIKNKRWTRSLLLVSSLTWILYLTGYEVLFRGILFTTSLGYIELIPAIVINASIYALVHVPKGARETFAALLYGSLICYFTYTTNGIWVALISHIALALSNEWFSVYYQIKEGNLEVVK